MISALETDTDKIGCGVAMLEAGDTFALHSYEHPEIYFGLEGEGDVMIDKLLIALRSALPFSFEAMRCMAFHVPKVR